MSTEITVDLDGMRGVTVSKASSFDGQQRALIHIELGVNDDLFIFGTLAQFIEMCIAVGMQVDAIKQSQVDAVAEVNAALDGKDQA